MREKKSSWYETKSKKNDTTNRREHEEVSIKICS